MSHEDCRIGVKCSPAMDLSVVIPVYNEADNLAVLCQQIKDMLGSFEGSYEVLIVDDGSTNGTFALLERLLGKDPSLRIIRLSRNFGGTLNMNNATITNMPPTVTVRECDGETLRRKHERQVRLKLEWPKPKAHLYRAVYLAEPNLGEITGPPSEPPLIHGVEVAQMNDRGPRQPGLLRGNSNSHGGDG